MLLDQIIPKLLEHCDPSTQQVARTLDQAVADAEQRLTQGFTEHQKQAFRNYIEAVNAYQCHEQEYLEKICFSLGAKFTSEIIQALDFQ